MFNKKLFAEFLEKAQGNRSLNAYSKEAGVAPAHVSRLKRALLDTPPSPLIIRKLADKAVGVSYGELMAAAGYISSKEEDDKRKAQRAYLLTRINPVYEALQLVREKKYEILSDKERADLDEMLERNDHEEIFDFIRSSMQKTSSDLNILDDTDNLFYQKNKDWTALVSNVIPTRPSSIKVPIIGTIACGDPILAEENIIGYRNQSPDMLPSGELYYVEAKGDSMDPTIPNGSLVLIREQNDVENGEIAAVIFEHDSEATLKRVKKQGDLVMLVPDNPQHEPIIITKDNPAKIIGKAVRCVRDL